MISISDAAQKYFAKLLMNQKSGTQIRIFVTNPGTYNAEINLSYCSLDSIKVNDFVLKFNNLTLYIDKESAPYLKNAEIDLFKDKFNSQLTIEAPNVKVRVLPNNSSLEERVQYLLQSQINPQLAHHGGNVSLIKITEDGYAILQFNGGCNGCPMVNFTLKEGIEKQLVNELPDLKGVLDFTEHQHGLHSYY